MCECFENTFVFDCGIPDLNLPSMPIHDIPHPKNIYQYTSNLPPANIYVSYKDYISTFTLPCNYQTIHFQISGIPATDHNVKIDVIVCDKREFVSIGIMVE